MSGFTLGWNPDSWASARERTTFARPVFGATDSDPPAMSLTAFRRRPLYQGQAGTCWVHSSIRLFELLTVGLDQYDYQPLCRCMAGYQGKQIEGGGNPTDGGNATDSLTAMSDMPNGLGVCRESLRPYKDSRSWLGQEPSAEMIADAMLNRIKAIAQITSDADARAAIARRHPVANGIWWPYAFDTQGGCLFSTYGGGVYGHSLTEVGYVTKGVWPGDEGNYDWWQLDNWHGELYKPLPPELAALVPGYKTTSPDKTTDFWVRGDCYSILINDRNAERVTAAGMSGWNPTAKPITLDEAIAL